MEALLRSEIEYDQQEAFEWLKDELIARIKPRIVIRDLSWHERPAKIL